jgi:hypothetical protein
MADGAVRARRSYVRRAYEQKVAITQAVCRRIEAGENLTEVCRDPRMPPRSTLDAWLGANDELRALVEAARSEAARTFPAQRPYHRWSAKVAAEVLARIEDGRGLREVCAEPDMPVHSTVTRWLNERPDYAEAYRQARVAQADRLFDLAWRIALEAREDEVATARLKIQTLKWRVGKLAPRKYGPLKAQAPEGDEAAGAAVQQVPRFEVRHFAATPEGKVVETTRAVRGMTADENQALRAAIREGRVTLDDLEAMARRNDEALESRR